MDYGLKKIIVTHALYSGDVVKQELIDIGFPVITADRLHIETKGDLKDVIKLNLYLRSAHRVLYFLYDFYAKNLNDLYQEIKKIYWEEIIPITGYFSIHSFVRQDIIRDFRIVNLKMKDAIVDRFKGKYNKRPDTGNQNDRLVFFIRWVKNRCELFLDSSGESLAKHGYRKHGWKAPLSESLAASIIYTMNWDKKSSFVNPMCGSGTLAIEAALIATSRYPGLFRDNYSLLHLKDKPQEIYISVKQQLKKIVDQHCSARIIASDKNPKAIEMAKANAQEAGVQELIQFDITEFQNTVIPDNPGVVILNPEYGLRLGEESELEKIYMDIGNFFKQHCNGFTGYVFTGNLKLGKHIGLRTKRKIPFLNGSIECRLLEYELYSGTRKNS